MSKSQEKKLTGIKKSDSLTKDSKTAQKVCKQSSSERLKEAKAKRKRPPLYSPNRFNVKEAKGYHKRIVSDREYDNCVERGYEPDPDYVHTKRSQDPDRIGQSRVSLGGGEHGTVMRQREEDFNADQKMKLETDKKRQAALLAPINENPLISASLDVTDVSFQDL